MRPAKAALSGVGWRVGLCVLSLSAAGGAERDDGALLHLDARRPTVQQAVGPAGGPPEGFKFVRVEVEAVVNPKRHPLTFDVRYRSGDTLTFLGSFSLYPSDHPGNFLVPTLGRVRAGGALLLSLVTPDTIGEDDPLSVTVRPMTLTDG
jgi:hypothetical protein